MKVFISYSFQDSELYIITLLFEQLHQRGFIVESSDSVEYYGTYSANISYRILKVDYFIGIITNHSDSINAVLREWDVARNNNKPNILIIEEGVRVEYPRALNMIRFNRNNPQVAIDQLLNINKPDPVTHQTKRTVFEDVVAVGALTVGLAALISLLSGDSKK